MLYKRLGVLLEMKLAAVQYSLLRIFSLLRKGFIYKFVITIHFLNHSKRLLTKQNGIRHSVLNILQDPAGSGHEK